MGATVPPQPAGATQRRRRDGRPVEELPPGSSSAQPPAPTGLGAVGLTAAVLGPALAAGAGGTLVDVATLPSAQAITLSAAAILAAFERFLDTRELVTEADVGELLEDEYGDVDEDVRLETVGREVLFDRSYRGKARARLDRDLPSILAIADEATRQEELRKVLDRERRFAEQREEAIAVRSLGSIEARVVEAASPEGAYWALSENVSSHTPDCLAMGGKVWPWTVLRDFHPPLHTGCACELRPVAAAVRLLGRAPEMPSPELAFAAMAVQEARWDPASDAWVDAEESADFYGVLEADQRRWGSGTTKGGQFRPRRGGTPGRPTGARLRVRKRRGDLLDLPGTEDRVARPTAAAPAKVAKKKGREIQVGDEVLVGGEWRTVEGVNPKVPGYVVLEGFGPALLDPDTEFDVGAVHGHDAGGEGEKGPEPTDERFTVGQPVGAGRTWADVEPGDRFRLPDGTRMTVKKRLSRVAVVEMDYREADEDELSGVHEDRVNIIHDVNPTAVYEGKAGDATPDPHAEIRAAIEKRRRRLADDPSQAERIRKFATDEAHAGDTPDELRGEWQELANEADAAMKAQRGGLEAPYHRGGVYGLPRLPEPSSDDRFELRFGKDVSLVMWDRRENKPYAVWDKDWNLDAVIRAVDEQNDAARGRQGEPPPAPKGLGEIEKLLRGKAPAAAGEIVPGFEFTGEAGKARDEDGVLKLPVGFFKQSRAIREGVVFRHLGRRLYAAMNDEDLQEALRLGPPDVPGTYAALNSPALQKKIEALEPERAAFIGRLARKHGMPLSPQAEAWLSERGVELEGDVHAGATGVEALPDPPALVDAKALAAELNTDDTLRRTFHFHAGERGFGRMHTEDDGSAIYRNPDTGITLNVPNTGTVTTELDSRPLDPEFLNRLEGRGTDVLTELASREGWTWTNVGGGRTTQDGWHRLVHPDGRAFEVYEAGNGYLATKPVSITPVEFGAPRAFTPPAKLVDDARVTRLRSRPAEAIREGDAFLGGDVSMEQQINRGGWSLETQTLKGQNFRSGVPGGVPTQSPWQQPQVHPDATEVRRYRRGPDALVVQLKDGTVVRAGYGDPDPKAHPGKVVTREEHDASSERLEAARQAVEAQETATGGDEAVQGLRDWLKSIEGRKLKRGETPPAAVLEALMTKGDSRRSTNDTVVMLREAGYSINDRRVQRRKGTVFYRLRGKDGSTLEVRGGVTYRDPAVESIKVIPNPQAGRRTRLEAGKVWKDADELYTDAIGRADELAERFGAVSDVKAVYDGPTGKALAHHEWNGTIVMSTNNGFRKRFEGYLEKRRAGSVTDRDHWDFYDAMSTLQHEVGHGVNTGRPLKPSEYRQGWDIAMEESLNEESARLLTLDWLRAQGMTDVLQAVKRMPKTDPRYIGSYTAYRGKLAKVLDAAGVAPDFETRRDLIYRMKFQMSTRERNAHLDDAIIERDEFGEHRERARRMETGVEVMRRQVEEDLARIARDKPESLEQAREAAEERIARQRYSPTKVMMGGSTRNFGGFGPRGFGPIVDDPLADVPYEPTPGEVASVGDRVVLMDRGQRVEGVLTVKRTEPRIGGGENHRVVVEAPGTRYETNQSDIVEVLDGPAAGARLDPAHGDVVMVGTEGRPRPVKAGAIVEVRVTGDDGEPEWVEGRVVDVMKASSGNSVKVEVDGMALWRNADRVR